MNNSFRLLTVNVLSNGCQSYKEIRCWKWIGVWAWAPAALRLCWETIDWLEAEFTEFTSETTELRSDGWCMLLSSSTCCSCCWLGNPICSSVVVLCTSPLATGSSAKTRPLYLSVVPTCVPLRLAYLVSILVFNLYCRSIMWARAMYPPVSSYVLHGDIFNLKVS